MSQMLDHAVSKTPDPRSKPSGKPLTKRKRRLGISLLLQVGAMIGIGALLYSNAADWFATLHHNSEISGYIESVEQLPTAERLAKLNVAHAYNSQLPQGMLRDPYGMTPEVSERDEAFRSYEQVLRVSENGVIGEVSYPRLGIGLPIYHGTSDEVISRGVGHLYGSSLPVGGPSTHSVLTAHSGLVNASLFTNLPSARIGDTFQMRVLGQTHHYRVDRIETVLPDQTESLRIVDGEDYVTLITCTPIGINSHRIFVRGERIEAPQANGAQAIDGDGRTAGFAWWAVGFVALSAVVAGLLFAPARKRRASTQNGGASEPAGGGDVA